MLHQHSGKKRFFFHSFTPSTLLAYLLCMICSDQRSAVLVGAIARSLTQRSWLTSMFINVFIFLYCLRNNNKAYEFLSGNSPLTFSQMSVCLLFQFFNYHLHIAMKTCNLTFFQLPAHSFQIQFSLNSKCWLTHLISLKPHCKTL